MESKIISITIKIGEDEFVLPFEEARQLFHELENIFGTRPQVSVPSVWEPYKTINIDSKPFKVTYTDTDGTREYITGYGTLTNTN